jgi:carbamoyl-phosphate synthase large subunit
MILIVSFNARPIANLANKLGLDIAIVDFWGDQDLFPLSEKVFTVFKPENKSYEAFPNPRKNEEKLTELALDIISKEDIESVLIGSGLDDRPDLWRRINTAAPILGNTAKCLELVRDLLLVQFKLAQERIKFPLTLWATHFSPIKDFADKIGFPIVIKPKKTLGGVGIQLANNLSELGDFCNIHSDNLRSYYFQAYIQGRNISSTLVGDKNKFKVLSINEQLIGLKGSGTKLPFKYCGNIVPFDCAPEVAQKIENISIKVAKMFKLRGVFGIDFVLENSEPVFMEINPRFPGTIELLEMVSELNAVRLHLDAIEGKIPGELEEFKGYAMKQVLFARNSVTTPDFRAIPDIFDISPQNILLNPEDPICTIQIFDTFLERLLQKMTSKVSQIYLKF